MAFLWTLVTVALAVLEAVTTQFICIWFAGGAFVALIASLIGLGVWWQIVLFILTSALLLFMTRSLVAKLKKNGPEKTNADAIIGTEAPVLTKVDNIHSEGTVKIGGIVWSARSESGEEIEVGTIVKVVRIEGVKLIVKEV